MHPLLASPRLYSDPDWDYATVVWGAPLFASCSSCSRCGATAVAIATAPLSPPGGPYNSMAPPTSQLFSSPTTRIGGRGEPRR